MTAKDKGEASGAEQRLIRELAEILDDTGLSEIEFEKSGLKIRVARELSVQPIAAAVPLAAPAAAAPPAAAAAAADPAKHPGAVKSPMVGTAYRSPEPGSSSLYRNRHARLGGRPALDYRSHEDDEPDPRTQRGQGLSHPL